MLLRAPIDHEKRPQGFGQTIRGTGLADVFHLSQMSILDAEKVCEKGDPMRYAFFLVVLLSCGPKAGGPVTADQKPIPDSRPIRTQPSSPLICADDLACLARCTEDFPYYGDEWIIHTCKERFGFYWETNDCDQMRSLDYQMGQSLTSCKAAPL